MKNILRLTPQIAVISIICAGMLLWRAELSPVAANCGTCGVPAPASGGAQGQPERHGGNSRLDRVRLGIDLFRILSDVNQQSAEQPQTAERAQQSAEHHDEHPTTRARPASPGAAGRTARGNGNAEPPSVCPLANEGWLCDQNLELSEGYCDALDHCETVGEADNAAKEPQNIMRAPTTAERREMYRRLGIPVGVGDIYPTPVPHGEMYATPVPHGEMYATPAPHGEMHATPVPHGEMSATPAPAGKPVDAARQAEAVDRALKAINAVNPAVPLVNAVQQNPPAAPQPQAGSDAIYDALRVIDTVNPVSWVRSWLGGAEPGCGIVR